MKKEISEKEKDELLKELTVRVFCRLLLTLLIISMILFILFVLYSIGYSDARYDICLNLSDVKSRFECWRLS